MNILYVGELDPEGTCYSRLKTLKNTGKNIETLDVNKIIKWNGLTRARRALEKYFLIGPNIISANKALLQKADQVKANLIWIDTSHWIFKKTLNRLKKKGIFLVHYTTDAFFPKNKRLYFSRKLMRKTIHLFDVLITTNSIDYNRLKEDNSMLDTSFISSKIGYDSDRFNPKAESTSTSSEVNKKLVFIGHYEPTTEKRIEALLEADLPITVYGNKPWFSSKVAKSLKTSLNPPLQNQDYQNALKEAEIALCFVSKWNYNSSAGRTFEIPASGTFLLAERTSEHSSCFIEGKEAEFFDSNEEMISKVKYYLKNPVQREQIAKKGLERCNNSGYSWEDNVKRDWKKVEEIFNKKIKK